MIYPGRWYSAPEDYIRGRWMQSPYEKVFIGSDPTEGMTTKTVKSFDAFINVADTPCETLQPYPHKNQAYHWFALNEVGYWGLGVFYWCNTILDKLISEKKTIYHHCHQGAHRSPQTFFVYLLYKGYSTKDASEIIGKNDHEVMAFFRDIKWGHISPYIFCFLESMQRHPDWSLMSILHYMKREFLYDENEKRILDPEFISNRATPQYDRETEAKGVDMKQCYQIMKPYLTDFDQKYFLDWNGKDYVSVKTT